MTPTSWVSQIVGEPPSHRNEEDVKDLLRPDDTRAWLKMLFRPGDLFEVRVKTAAERGAKQIWLPYGKIEDFVNIHVPTHTEWLRHIWVGIAPRPAVDDSTPVLHRALWVDFSESVKSVDGARAHILAAKLPPATMLVWSGNGVHAYWALERDCTPAEVRPFAKGLHQALPTDATHDSTRIMRVPGTVNCKDPEHPHACYIAEHAPERVYDLQVFPQAEVTEAVATGAKPAQMEPLSQEDRELFLANWIDGIKHKMVLAVAGYLRKNLYYDEASALEEIVSIHREAGYEPDELLVQAVKDTYKRVWSAVAGMRGLEELGIRPKVRDVFKFRIVTPPKRKMEIIDFTEDLQEQEFWVHGLVGPGLLTMWAGGPKTGKSFAAMQIGYALASGQKLWDLETDPTPRRVLYFQGELSKGMVYSRAKSMFGLPAIRDPRRFAMTAKPDEPINLIRTPEALTDLAESYDVIIVDPISVFHQNDEKSSHNVNEIVSVFDHLRSMGKAVILVHHTRKLDTDRQGKEVTPSFNDIRGSGAWFATADALALHYKTDETGLHTRVKFVFRAAPDRDPLDLHRMPHGGFTHDKNAFIAAHPTFRVRTDALN